MTQASNLHPWRKSRHSAGDGNCIEVALGTHLVCLRDSKNPEGGRLAVGPEAFRSFLRGVKAD
jgi:hypothetical protein